MKCLIRTREQLLYRYMHQFYFGKHFSTNVGKFIHTPEWKQVIAEYDNGRETLSESGMRKIIKRYQKQADKKAWGL
jgi:hypothetical protein